MKQFFKDFGAFIAKGNVLDLAVALVIGTAFNAIIKSLVNDIIMPFISLIGGKDIANWVWLVRGTSSFDTVTGSYIYSADAVIVRYGAFIQSIVDFLIIALAIFLALRLILKFRTRVEQVRAKLATEENKTESETK